MIVASEHRRLEMAMVRKRRGNGRIGHFRIGSMNVTKDRTKQILQALRAVFLAFPAQERTGTETEMVRVYELAVEGVPSDFIAMACRRFIGGQVQEQNNTFRPTPAELASEARRLMNAAQESERIRNLPWPPERPRLTGPRQPFEPYPALWDALRGEPDLLKALKAETFDGMSALSKLFATEGIEAVRYKLRPIASAPARHKAGEAA
jgi:hypothetical protein